MDYKAAAAQLKEAPRLRTEPFGAIFFKNPADLPQDPAALKSLRQESHHLPGVTLARPHGWPGGSYLEDLICIPGMLMFGFLRRPPTPSWSCGQLFCEVGFH